METGYLEAKYERALDAYDTTGDEVEWNAFLGTLTEDDMDTLHLDSDGLVDMFVMFDEDDDLGRAMREDYDREGIPY